MTAPAAILASSVSVRACENCEKPLVRRYSEGRPMFSGRRFCSIACSAAFRTKPELERFLSHCLPEPNSGCWIWVGGYFSNGYGCFHTDGRTEHAHRTSYRLFHGPLTKSMCACHRCDVRACVNPEHIFAGTHLDNSNDKYKKGRGRHRSGETHPHAKLNPGIARLIRSSPETIREMAKSYGVTHGTIQAIRSGRTWKDAQ